MLLNHEDFQTTAENYSRNGPMARDTCPEASTQRHARAGSDRMRTEAGQFSTDVAAGNLEPGWKFERFAAC